LIEVILSGGFLVPVSAGVGIADKPLPSSELVGQFQLRAADSSYLLEEH
jgi:hypothetical protein